MAMAAAILFCGAPAVGAQKQGAQSVQVKIEAVQARFFYETTGVLSDNIAPPASFSAFNSMIGEGDAKQPANDLIVTVVLSADRKDVNADTPLSVVVKGKQGRIIAQRVFKDLFFKGDRLVKALFAPDAACLGHITIDAALGKESRTAAIDLDCGE
jgi:hypothetical protein